MLYQYFTPLFITRQTTRPLARPVVLAPFFNATTTNALGYNASRYHFFSRSSRRKHHSYAVDDCFCGRRDNFNYLCALEALPFHARPQFCPKNSRTSPTKSIGQSSAGKWPPASCSVRIGFLVAKPYVNEALHRRTFIIYHRTLASCFEVLLINSSNFKRLRVFLVRRRSLR